MDGNKLAMGIGVALFAATILYGPMSRLQVEPPEDLWFRANVVDRNDLVLVKFGAEWCGPCRAVAPVLENLDNRVSGLSVVQIDIDEKPELAQHYGVSGIPRLLLLRNGKVQASRVGSTDIDTLEKWVQGYL